MITFPLLYVPNKDGVKGVKIVFYTSYKRFCLCFGDLFLDYVLGFFFS